MAPEPLDNHKLEDSADESWLDSGDRSAPPEEMTLTQMGGRVESRRASRYEPGAVIADKYQLIEALGEGAMGSVWIAKNRTLDVDVAIKLMRAEFTHDVDGIAERMLQEARAAACIGHPAIIQVFDFGFAEFGDPFIVMELLRGESLEQALGRRHRVSPNRAVRTLLPIIDALAATHAQGIVHRDLKPANIFLSRPAGQRLQPKVLDFGVAKLERRAAERLTIAGAMVGSPAYMSPEQIRGEAVVDGRADIWGLCVVLYEMITSDLPFEINEDGSILGSVLTAAPRPISEHGLDESALWQILEKGFAKEPSGRYSSMRAFGSKLAEWLVARGINEDICDASLRPWLTPTGVGAEAVHSFFPSQEPGVGAPHNLVVDPLSQEVRSATASGQSPNQRIATMLRPLFVGSKRKLAWAVAGGLLLGLLALYALPGKSASMTAQTVNRQAAPERQLEPVTLVPSSQPTPLPIEVPVVAKTTSNGENPSAATQPSALPAPARRFRVAPPDANRNKASRDLKNPFE